MKGTYHVKTFLSTKGPSKSKSKSKVKPAELAKEESRYSASFCSGLNKAIAKNKAPSPGLAHFCNSRSAPHGRDSQLTEVPEELSPEGEVHRACE